MKDDDKFEIVRAMDLLPHVAGASFATIHFRLEGERRPTRQQFRDRTVTYFEAACRALDMFPQDERFKAINKYVEGRTRREISDIVEGHNREVEKRYERYLDYG